MKRRVLVADDSSTTRNILTGMLRSCGYEVVEATDGREALSALLEDSAPDVALIDWVMPGVCGPELCRMIRAQQRQVRPHLILLTGKTDTEALVEGLESGADDYLRKPTTHAELRARVEVGFRIIDYQRDLAEQVARYETVLRRHDLMFEAKRRTKAAETPAVIPSGANLRTVPGLGPIGTHLEPLAQIPTVFPRTVAELGMGDVQWVPDRKPEPTGLMTWGPLVLPTKQTILDLVVTASPGAVEKLLGDIMDGGGTLHERADGLREVLNVLRSVLRPEIARKCDVALGLPVVPKVAPASKISGFLLESVRRASWAFEIEGEQIGVFVVERPADTMKLSPGLMSVGLVAVGEIFLGGTSSPIPRGAVLDAKHLAALREAAHRGARQELLVLVPPSDLPESASASAA